MARVTVEDAVKQVGNRFDLVLVAARRARLGIGAAKNHPLGPAVDNCAGTHRTWFLGHIEHALFQPPIAEALLCGGEGKHNEDGRGHV